MRVWFPSLKTLILTENYSDSPYEDFREFMDDPWLDHIWIQDHQTNQHYNHKTCENHDISVPETYPFINQIPSVGSDSKVRVFRCSQTEIALAKNSI